MRDIPIFHLTKTFELYKTLLSWYETTSMMIDEASESLLDRILSQQRSELDKLGIVKNNAKFKLKNTQLTQSECFALEDEISLALAQEHLAVDLIVAISTNGQSSNN